MSKCHFSSVFSDLGCICWVINVKFNYVDYFSKGKIFDRLNGAQVLEISSHGYFKFCLSACPSVCLSFDLPALLYSMSSFLSVCPSVCLYFISVNLYIWKGEIDIHCKKSRKKSLPCNGCFLFPCFSCLNLFSSVVKI